MNVNFQCLLIILGIAVYFPTLAAEKAKTKHESPVHTRVAMNQLLEKVTTLRTFSNSEKNFLEPKNEEQISKALHEFSEVLRSVKYKDDLNTNNYYISKNALADHVAHTAAVFDSGNKTFARWMVNSTLAMCMNCHTQFPTYSRKNIDSNKQKNLFTDFEQAEFLFATRDFEQALELYRKILSKADKYSYFDVERSAERIVIYYSRVKRELNAGIKELNGFVQNTTVPELVRNRMKGWITEFELLSKRETINPQTASEADARALAQEFVLDKSKLGVGDRFVSSQYVAGLFAEYLQSHPLSKVTPEILYWLALSDSAIADNVFFQNSDIYLRECVIRFPKSDVAQDCYREYEERTLASHTGTAGTFLPKEIESDLKRLKKMIRTRKK